MNNNNINKTSPITNKKEFFYNDSNKNDSYREINYNNYLNSSNKNKKNSEIKQNKSNYSGMYNFFKYINNIYLNRGDISPRRLFDNDPNFISPYKDFPASSYVNTPPKPSFSPFNLELKFESSPDSKNIYLIYFIYIFILEFSSSNKQNLSSKKNINKNSNNNIIINNNNFKGKKINFNDDENNQCFLKCNNDDENINNINIINSNFSNVIINNLTNSSKLISPNNNKNIMKNNKNINNYSNNNNNNINKINDNNNNNKNNLIINNNLNNPQKICCICTKTNCIKKYCACFANGRFCENCECQNCLNTRENATTDINILQKNNIENIICNCSRSNCQKKYCECYKAGKSCGPICRCIGCLNTNNNNSTNSFNNTPHKSSNSNNNNNNNHSDKKNKKNNRLSYINHFIRNLTIDNLNVSIINGVINVIFEKINLDVQKTPKLLNRKKNRIKNESTNMKTISNINSTNIKKKKENKVAKSKKILSFK